MVKKLMVAVAMVALFAAPSFAAVQNVKVGGDIVTTSVIRDNFNVGNATIATGAVGRQNVVLGQTRVNVSADLTDNVSTFVSLQNENLWGANTATGYSNNVVLSASYVTLKELLYAPLTLTVGRQPLAYGNKLIIGNAGYAAFDGVISDLTYATNFDAIKAVLAYEPLTIDMFASRVNNNGTGGALINSAQLNTNLYGINANYKMGDKMSTVVEGYVFAKTVDAATQKASSGTYVPGLRLSTNPIEGLNVQLEGAYEFGRVNHTPATTPATNDNLKAYALQGGLNYALPVLKDLKPVLGVQYTYLSGKAFNAYSNGSNWDPMYMDQNAGRIFYAKGFASGVQRATLSAAINPLKDVTTTASATAIWDATRKTNTPDATSRYEGTEADLDVSYAYTEDVKFGVSAGYFMTGKANGPAAAGLTGYDNKNASQLLSSVSVLF